MLGSSSARVKVKDEPLYLDGRTSGLVETGDGGWKKVKVNVRLIRISVSEAAKARGNNNNNVAVEPWRGGFCGVE